MYVCVYIYIRITIALVTAIITIVRTILNEADARVRHCALALGFGESRGCWDSRVLGFRCSLKGSIRGSSKGICKGLGFWGFGILGSCVIGPRF